MKKNIGSVDRYVRILLGTAIMIIGYLENSFWGIIGIVLIITAFVRWCPLYLPFGISTMSKLKNIKES